MAGPTGRLSSPEVARALGIGMVFQHFSLFENLTVGENIALVLPKRRALGTVGARIAEVARRYGLALDAHRPVWTCPPGSGSASRSRAACCRIPSC